jgi:hypothetical protein
MLDGRFSGGQGTGPFGDWVTGKVAGKLAAKFSPYN